MSKILSVKNLTVALGEETILENLTFDLEKNDALAVIGPNGSGKTVLLKTLLGMFRYSGEIQWGENIRLGYVPQKIDADRHLPINLNDLLSAKASLLKDATSEIQEIPKTLGLDKKVLSTPVGHLSGGEFQRALIALALIGRPNTLIFDEPTASIDKPGEEQIYELIHRLQDQYGMTVILVSHDLSVVYRYATKVLCLNKSGLCFGTPDEALTTEVLEKLYGPHKYFHHYHHLHKHD